MTRKVAKGQEANYFESMTDMMIGVLFIFIIMVAYFAFQITSESHVPFSLYEVVKEENGQLKNKIAELLQRILGLEKQIEELNKPNPVEQYVKAGNAARNDIVDEVVQELKASDIEAKAVFQQGVVTISGQGLFANGRSDLESKRGAKIRVDKLSDIMRDRIKCFVLGAYADLKAHKRCNPSLLFLEAVFIEGHTDNRPISVGRKLSDGSRNNLELSARRATNTYRQLITRNPGLTSYENPAEQQVLSVAAYGEQRPIDDNGSSEGRQNNRRIDIRFVMYVPKDKLALAAFRAQFE